MTGRDSLATTETKAPPEYDSSAGVVIQKDIVSQVFMIRLKQGLDNVHATVNNNTMFMASAGQLMLYWNSSHTAFLPDGRFGYIDPLLIQRVDTPCFRFTFSQWQFAYEKDNDLYKTAEKNGIELNDLLKRIQKKDPKALLQFFRLQKVADGAAAEAFPEAFWALINQWNDKELSSFIATLDKSEKSGFCNLLIESAYCSPYEYYTLYYPMTMKQIVAEKSSG